MIEATLRTSICDWLTTIIPALWVGAGNARPANTIAFVWHMEDNSRPATPILEARLSALTRIGRDAPSGPDAHGSQTYTGDREEMVYLHFFGTGARDYLLSIQNAIQDTTIRPTVSANGFIIVDSMPILDAHEYLDTMPEDGATLDLRIRYIDTWTTASGSPGLISTVNELGPVGSADMSGTIN